MAESQAVDVAVELVLWASFSLCGSRHGAQQSFTLSQRARDVTCMIYLMEGCKQKRSFLMGKSCREGGRKYCESYFLLLRWILPHLACWILRFVTPGASVPSSRALHATGAELTTQLKIAPHSQYASDSALHVTIVSVTKYTKGILSQSHFPGNSLSSTNVITSGGFNPGKLVSC